MASYYVSGMKTSQFMCHLLFPGEDDHTSLVLSGSTIPLPNATRNLQFSRRKINDAIARFEQIAGLQVTSRRPCWWSRTKTFLSAGKWTLFWCKFSRKISFVLTTNMASLSRGYKPRIVNPHASQTINKRSFQTTMKAPFSLWPATWRRRRNMPTKNTNNSLN